MELREYNKEDIYGLRVILRCDLDVKTGEDGFVEKFQSLRLERIIPQIKELVEFGAKQIIIIGHKGRPEGFDPKFSLAPVCDHLSDLCKQEDVCEPIVFVDNIFAEKSVFSNERVIMLENLRFDKGERQNSEDFAQKLALWGDVYINNAFGSSHRDEASISLLPKFIKESFAGIGLRKEIEELENFLSKEAFPKIAVLGGSKISTKLPLIKILSSKCDKVLLGGALANSVLEARGFNIGKSLNEKVSTQDAEILSNENIIIPEDVVLEDGRTCLVSEVGNEDLIFDIGPITNKKFVQEIYDAKSILWNGPMGKIEDEKFFLGTKSVALAIATNEKASTVAGGGETLEAIDRIGILNDFDFVSTGGGAMLYFLSSEDMPGLEVLKI